MRKLSSHIRVSIGANRERQNALFVRPSNPGIALGRENGVQLRAAGQNVWSRSLHFQAAWILVFTGVLYIVSGLFTRHFRSSLLPARRDLKWRALSATIANHARFKRSGDVGSYNVLQRLTYLMVIFVLFPLMIWTGLAMSPAFTGAFPATVTPLGGQQSARTIHFFGALAPVLFLLIHVLMVVRAGFTSACGK